MSSIAPGEEELGEALVKLRSENATLGISKIHALLVKTYPSWTVSEKRTRKILQSKNLTLTTPTSSSSSASTTYPTSNLIPHLDPASYTPKITIQYLNSQKGKGLIAKDRISEGEELWKEDPWVIAPEWEVYDLQKQGFACGFCTTMFNSSTKARLIVSCPTSPGGEGACKMRYCNRLCASRATQTHPFLCPSQNPACLPLLQFARETEWMALHALAQVTSRFLGLLCLTPPVNANVKGEAGNARRKKDLQDSYEILTSLATLSLSDRARLSFNQEPNHTQWRQVYAFYLRAFSDPEGEAEKKKFRKLLGARGNNNKGLWEGFEVIEKELFSYEVFLRNLGRMSLNLESHGGLYPLHSHLNHSCLPNISVRHLDTRSALSRITLVARRDIGPGEELEIAYVNPGLGWKRRREEVKGWGFACKCKRCEEEAVDEGEKKEEEKEERKAGQKDGEELRDLEEELKAGLGLL